MTTKEAEKDAYQKQSTMEEEKYHCFQAYFYKLLEKIWSVLPNSVGVLVATVLIFLAGTTMRGDWLLILVYFIKQFGSNSSVKEEDDSSIPEREGFSLANYRLQSVHFYVLFSALISYGFYFVLCGFLQWYFYIRQRDCPEKWKCQPKKFLTWKDEKHEIILGSICMGIGATISGVIACYIMNGGYSALYFDFTQYGWLYYFLSAPLLFIYMDMAAYYFHRMYHLPYLYKHFHKWHHRYKQPTAFSASAIHPFEFINYQTLLALPMFFVPIHWSVYISVLSYIFYYGIMDHSGIKLEAIWPWQPNSMFHDDHHQFFHCNFGFNLTLWDKLHGTFRIKSRIYNENTFYGYGKSTEDATTEELEEYQNARADERSHLKGD
ncbi:methylsterol monooxygenase 1-like [Tachypleus tridentatus]|uniref:methylsterol monooxygenase 1-like n=1 Tax=Tachypleus tridentatus TaxID=6853 RepID=UPI003FD0700B